MFNNDALIIPPNWGQVFCRGNACMYYSTYLTHFLMENFVVGSIEWQIKTWDFGVCRAPMFRCGTGERLANFRIWWFPVSMGSCFRSFGCNFLAYYCVLFSLFKLLHSFKTLKIAYNSRCFFFFFLLNTIDLHCSTQRMGGEK